MALGSGLRGELTACHLRVDLEGPVDAAALARAVERASDAHFRLRSRIVPSPRCGPLQTVYRFAEGARAGLDRAGGDADAWLDRAIDPFAGPGWRFGLFPRSGGASFRIAWHHAHGDGMAGFEVAGTVFDFYREETAGVHPPLPPPPSHAPRLARGRFRFRSLLREISILAHAAATRSRERPIGAIHRLERTVRLEASGPPVHALALAAAARPLARLGLCEVAMPFNLRDARLRHAGIGNSIFMINARLPEPVPEGAGERLSLATSLLRDLQRHDVRSFRIASAFIAAAPRFALRWMAGKTHRGARVLLSVLGDWPERRLRDRAGRLELAPGTRIAGAGGGVPLIAGIEHSIGVGVLRGEAVLTLTSDAAAISREGAKELLDAMAAEMAALRGGSSGEAQRALGAPAAAPRRDSQLR